MAEVAAGARGAEAQWVVSDFAGLGWRDGQAHLTAASSGARLSSEGMGLIGLVHAFARAQTIASALSAFAEPERSEARAAIDDLIRSGILEHSAVKLTHSRRDGNSWRIPLG